MHSLSLVFLCSGAALAQSAGPTPTFEVADVHASAPGINQRMTHGARGTRVEMRTATMVDLIVAAYGVDDDKVFGGPSWLEMNRYDVIARSQGAANPETQKLMLQSLLADRFQLVVHQETRPMPAYNLTAGKHPLLKEADGSGEPGCRTTLQGLPNPPQADAPRQSPILVLNCHSVTMAAFAEEVRDLVWSRQNTGPVLDRTGLKGSWDFSFKVPFELLGSPDAASPAIEAIDKQLGLKVETVNVPLPVIVVQSVNEKPTGNSADVAKLLPVPPTEFEVADIKPAAPAQVLAGRKGGGGGRGGPPIRSGKFDVRGITVKSLITMAWDLGSDEQLVGAPKWLDTDRYDIIAKIPVTGAASDAPIDIDSRPMIRAMLADRFKLAVHTEERPVSGFTLTAARPKLKKADASARTRFIEGPGPDMKDPRTTNPALSRLVTCQNMTMAQFASLLPSIASGYVRTPVLDATGLGGAWDFTLSFSAAGIVNGGGRGGDFGPAPGGVSGAADPSGGLSLFDALTKQLGLKLEMQKRPMPVLVIDHMEQKPTDN